MPNPRTRERRLKLFVLPFLLAGALAYGSVHQIWYTAILSPTQVQNQPAQANITITGAGIATMSAAPVSSDSTGTISPNTNPSVGSKLGFIDPIFYVLLAALLGTLGALASSLLLTGGAILADLFAWSMLASLRAQFENPLTTGGFTLLRGPGQSRLWLGLTLMLGFGTLSLVQVILIHHAQRKANNDPGLFTHFVGSIVNRAGSVVRDIARDHEPSDH
jgi:hypothetical protein